MKREIQESPIEVYTLSDCARALKVTHRSIQTYVKNGTLKATKVGGKYLVTKDDLVATILGTTAGEK